MNQMLTDSVEQQSIAGVCGAVCKDIGLRPHPNIDWPLRDTVTLAATASTDSPSAAPAVRSPSSGCTTNAAASSENLKFNPKIKKKLEILVNKPPTDHSARHLWSEVRRRMRWREVK